MRWTADGTPVQSSVCIKPSNYRSLEMYAPKLGVLLEVRYADNPVNRSASTQSDFRGYIAEASVLLVDDGVFLPKVLITPDSASGLDNFEELLPKGSTKTVTGQEYDSNLTQIDPNDLDGDWCIVQFIDGKIQTPYISRYWPNPRNVYDCATSGMGNPQFTTGIGRALDQTGRYFRRTNGVEYVITREGNIWISTNLSGSKLSLNNQDSNAGDRFPRLNNSEGGSILVNIKPSQLFELSFNEQVDGIGSDSLADSSLPQKNPAIPSPVAKKDTSTRLSADKDKITIDSPISFNVRAKKQVLIDSDKIVLGEDADDRAALSQKVLEELNKIITKLNEFISLFNTHTHGVIVTPPAVITSSIPNAIQSAADTADPVNCDLVYIE